jgi:hypothetical protein
MRRGSEDEARRARAPGEARRDQARKPPKVRLTFEVSQEMNELLDKLADESGGTKSELLRKAIALMEVAVEAKRKRNALGVIDSQDRLVTKIVAL